MTRGDSRLLCAWFKSKVVDLIGTTILMFQNWLTSSDNACTFFKPANDSDNQQNPKGSQQ